MKKNMVMVIVALFAVLLGLQYMQNREKAGVSELSRPGQPSDSSAGVPLPNDATSYAATDPVVDSAAYMTPRAAVAFSRDADGSLAVCQGHTLGEVLDTHGVAWGHVKKEVAFSWDETRQVYDSLAAYLSCRAALAGSLKPCEMLPATSGGKPSKDDFYLSPRYQCQAKPIRVLFHAYAEGRLKDPGMEICKAYMGSDMLKGGKFPADMCKNITVGFAEFCTRAPGSHKKDCYRTFPSAPDNCEAEHCRISYSIYRAMRAADPSACMPEYATECGAFLSKSPGSCNALLRGVGEAFCPAYEKYSAKLAAEAEKKLAADRKKEEQQTITEINKRARTILGKDADKGKNADKDDE